MRILTHPTIKVLSGPTWLMDMYNGFKNEKGTALIDVILDPNGTPIIGKSILNDTDFDVDKEIVNPTNNELTTPRKEMYEIDFVYSEETE